MYERVPRSRMGRLVRGYQTRDYWVSGPRPGGAIGAAAHVKGETDVNRLRCEDCGTRFYSAAGRTLVERGERCELCGGPLLLEPPPGEPPLSLSGKESDDRAPGDDA